VLRTTAIMRPLCKFLSLMAIHRVCSFDATKIYEGIQKHRSGAVGKVDDARHKALEENGWVHVK
jgi:hypothetical protein